MGAASLAQCHRGVLREDGRVVAVKIQHPDVGRNAYTDMDTMDVSGRVSYHSRTVQSYAQCLEMLTD